MLNNKEVPIGIFQNIAETAKRIAELNKVAPKILRPQEETDNQNKSKANIDPITIDEIAARG